MLNFVILIMCIAISFAQSVDSLKFQNELLRVIKETRVMFDSDLNKVAQQYSRQLATGAMLEYVNFRSCSSAFYSSIGALRITKPEDEEARNNNLDGLSYSILTYDNTILDTIGVKITNSVILHISLIETESMPHGFRSAGVGISKGRSEYYFVQIIINVLPKEKK